MADLPNRGGYPGGGKASETAPPLKVPSASMTPCHQPLTGEQATAAIAPAQLDIPPHQVMTDEEAAEFRQRWEELAPGPHGYVLVPSRLAAFPDVPADFAASVIIVWGHPREPGVLDGWKTAILDAASGEMITTISRLAVHSSPTGIIWAQARIFANPDGKPVLGSPKSSELHLDAGGEVLEGTFALLVAGMRIAEQPGSAWPGEAGADD